MLKNVRVLLNKPTVDLVLSESSATPSTFSPVNFNTTNQKKQVVQTESESSYNLSNFVKPTPIQQQNKVITNSISQTSSDMPNRNTRSLSSPSVSDIKPKTNTQSKKTSANTNTNKIGNFRYRLTPSN